MTRIYFSHDLVCLSTDLLRGHDPQSEKPPHRSKGFLFKGSVHSNDSNTAFPASLFVICLQADF